MKKNSVRVKKKQPCKECKKIKQLTAQHERERQQVVDIYDRQIEQYKNVVAQYKKIVKSDGEIFLVCAVVTLMCVGIIIVQGRQISKLKANTKVR